MNFLFVNFVKPRLPPYLRTPTLVWLLAVIVSLSGCGGGESVEPVPPAAPVALATPADPASTQTPSPPLLAFDTGLVAAPIPSAPVVLPVPAPIAVFPPIPPAANLPTADCALPVQRDWLRADMDARYFWRETLASGNLSAPGIDAYFRSLLDVPRDRYSYSQASREFTDFYNEGTRTGYGYSLVWANAQQTQLLVRFVEPNSPVGQAGLQRGETIVDIDGFSPMQIASGALAAVNTPGVARSFLVSNAAGVRRLSVVSRNFPLTTVSGVNVVDITLTNSSQRSKVGYLAFHEFIVSSETALDAAFTRFVSEGATELVLDLRYNGGGSVILARALASMIGGAAVDGRTFASLRFNARRSADNYDIPFNAGYAFVPGPVLAGLKRVVVLTGPGTASASELLVNSLKPFMPVVLVGSTTYGKPYGFTPRENCGTVFNAVTFETVNALGEGNFSRGFAPTCAAADDLNRALGDPNEGQLSIALSYLRTGQCPVQPLARLHTESGKSTAVFGEVATPQMWVK